MSMLYGFLKVFSGAKNIHRQHTTDGKVSVVPRYNSHSIQQIEVK